MGRGYFQSRERRDFPLPLIKCCKAGATALKCRRDVQKIKTSRSDSPRMCLGNSLGPDEYFCDVVIGPHKAPRINVPAKYPNRRRFLCPGNLTPKPLQADCVWNFNCVNMRKNKRIARCFNDGNRVPGI